MAIDEELQYFGELQAGLEWLMVFQFGAGLRAAFRCQFGYFFFVGFVTFFAEVIGDFGDFGDILELNIFPSLNFFEESLVLCVFLLDLGDHARARSIGSFAKPLEDATEHSFIQTNILLFRKCLATNWHIRVIILILVWPEGRLSAGSPPTACLRSRLRRYA